MPAQRLSAMEERWLQNSVTQRRGRGIRCPGPGQQMLGLRLLLGSTVAAAHRPPTAAERQQQQRTSTSGTLNRAK